MKNQKISQASIEYLSTYALAFISIVTAIGALYYFGFLDFGKYLPQKCTFPSQFKCLDFSLNSNPSNEIRIKLVNNLGEDICVKKGIGVANDAVLPLNCDDPAIVTTSPCAADEWKWGQANTQELIFKNCKDGAYTSNERIDARVTMTYYAINSPSKTMHIVNGKISGRVLS